LCVYIVARITLSILLYGIRAFYDITKMTDEAKVRKIISPYDITTTNNPGSLLADVQLNGKNYDEWARYLRIALRARKKFGFIDETIEKPAEKSIDLAVGGLKGEQWLIPNIGVSRNNALCNKACDVCLKAK